MPIYEFQCSKCRKQFEISRPMSKASAAAKCPKCKATAKRLFSATIITTGTASSDFDLSDMPDFGGMGDMGMGGDDHGHSHGPPGMPPGMPDMGDFDF